MLSPHTAKVKSSFSDILNSESCEMKRRCTFLFLNHGIISAREHLFFTISNADVF